MAATTDSKQVEEAEMMLKCMRSDESNKKVRRGLR